jgi:hypothetical protein
MKTRNFDYSKNTEDIFYRVIYPLYAKEFIFGNDYEVFVNLIKTNFILNNEQWEYISEHWDKKESMLMDNMVLSENKKEQFLFDIMKDMERIVDKNNSNIIWWKKNNRTYFKQDEKNKDLWCDYYLVWSVFYSEFDMNYDEIQALISNMMKKHYKLGYLTPQQQW